MNIEPNLYLDKIFKAIADQNRRMIIEILKKTPGININQLCKSFVISRFAIMKHVNILEDSNIIVSEKDMTSRRMYLNQEVLKKIYRDWLQPLVD